MPSVQELLLLDLCLLGVLCASIALSLRQALKQGRAKKALENSLASAQTPIAANPFISSRLAPAGAMTHEAVASVFAPQHAVPEVRRPLWSDTVPVVHADPWIDHAVAPEEQVVEQPFVFALEAPAAEVVEVAAEEMATPELPREHVGILFLEDDQDIAALKLAEVTEFVPRAASAELAVEKEHPAPVEFIDDVYADPIDGVPFIAGEEVVPCACGSAYRTDTVEWLRETAGGECVQCHRMLSSATRRIPEDGPSMEMARSA